MDEMLSYEMLTVRPVDQKLHSPGRHGVLRIRMPYKTGPLVYQDMHGRLQHCNRHFRTTPQLGTLYGTVDHDMSHKERAQP